nr:PREDICTED: uncharacterized protein LOC109641724 isoform X2 [Paralichthys olivaceus]
MLLRIILVCVHVVRALSPDEVIGYLGDSVTLPSRADPSWKLDTIEWSILSNNTWIATHTNRKTNTERFWQHRGRLSLNNKTGDLTIHHLKREDEMEYTVDLISTERNATVNKVRLIIKQHLQPPTIETLFKLRKEGGCWTGLRCSSQDGGVDFSWKVKPLTAEAFSTLSNAEGNSGAIFTFLNNTEIHEFTCTTSRNKDKVSGTFFLHCETPRERWGMYLALGFAVVTVIKLWSHTMCSPEKMAVSSSSRQEGSRTEPSTESINNV